jgi:hypothetical protein
MGKCYWDNDIIEALESDLESLRNLLELLSDFFNPSINYIKENPASIILGYKKYGSLNYACIDYIDNMLSMISDINKKNYQI